MSDIIKEWNSSLSSIEFLHEIGENHAAVKIGAATTNLEMLEWVRPTEHILVSPFSTTAVIPV